jgi:hypothetical protein
MKTKTTDTTFSKEKTMPNHPGLQYKPGLVIGAQLIVNIQAADVITLMAWLAEAALTSEDSVIQPTFGKILGEALKDADVQYQPFVFLSPTTGFPMIFTGGTGHIPMDHPIGIKMAISDWLIIMTYFSTRNDDEPVRYIVYGIIREQITDALYTPASLKGAQAQFHENEENQNPVIQILKQFTSSLPDNPITLYTPDEDDETE